MSAAVRGGRSRVQAGHSNSTEQAGCDAQEVHPGRAAAAPVYARLRPGHRRVPHSLARVSSAAPLPMLSAAALLGRCSGLGAGCSVRGGGEGRDVSQVFESAG